MKPPVCRTCGGKVLYGNLYCSKSCGQQVKVHSADLIAAGFVQDEQAPNVFVKDGVAVTVEAINHVGLDQTLRAHAHAAAGHAAK